MGYNEFFFFLGFLLFIFTMLMLDLGLFNRKQHVISFKEAAAWSFVWVVCALVFYTILLNYGHLIHGIDNFKELDKIVLEYLDDPEDVTLNPNDFEASLASYRSNMAIEFITGYLLEYSLSVDNIFVIILIFTSFGVREKYYKKVLMWGILGAVVMRFIFIFVGSALIHNFHFILYIFGGFLIISGAKMFFDKEDEEIDTEKNPIVRFASRYFTVIPRYVNDKFFVRNRQGVFMITPLFLVVLIIEFTDLLFAVDSVPAVFAVTKDPYIVFFSNIFAIMGLRSMFFFLSNVMHIFHYLKTGLAFLLMFIGVKMIAYENVLKPIGFKSHYSLIVILGILAISVIASLLFPPKKKVHGAATQANDGTEATSVQIEK
ncbi:MAG: TerC/Alx family metal homeostasis membrane protein [Cytophagales bacterium]|nr:MAG: TerC/Alx family metal homeostasis membrane protein [Cytophagales bacterium]